MNAPILKIKNLKMHFPVHGGILWRKIGTVFALDGVSFSINPGETLGVVGESGCGKTTLGRTIIRLYQPTDGKIEFNQSDISKLSQKEIRPLRREMQMIFQDPFESLNSRQTIKEIIEEPFIIHGIGSSKDREKEVRKILDRVGLQQDAINRFPHEFSGGQRQRIGIARAIALKPKLIICDEPVSALDVSIQSQILNLLIELQQELQLTYLFIAHDLSVVKHVSDFVAVMYLGKIVEHTDADTIYNAPKHPYTKALISAIPVPDPNHTQKKQVLQGDVPSPQTPPSGCHFHTRCPHKIDKCTQIPPKLELFNSSAPNQSNSPANGQDQNSHWVACHRIYELE